MWRGRFFKTVQWKVVVIYVLLILIAMQFIAAYFSREVESYYTNNFAEVLNERATLLATLLEQDFQSRDKDKTERSPEEMKERIDTLIRKLVELDATVQVVDQNGIVISTTDDQSGNIIGQKTAQKEITIALLGTKNESLRIDPKTNQQVKVLAVPIGKGSTIYGAVYMVASMENVDKTIRNMISILATGTAIAMCLTVGLGIVLARTITTPVKEMTRQATSVAEGDFDRAVRVYSDDEIGQLGMAFNHMTTRLKEAVLQQEEEREKLSQILENMSDGVIAADREGKIILVNRPAEDMLEISQEEVLSEGKTLYDVLRLPTEEEMPLFAVDEPLILEMMLSNRELLMLKVTFSPLQQDSGKKGGIIAVLQDITEQARLEKQRREFVANVSHELRTPLTTIKSYVEALIDGAVLVPELSERFLNVTMTETERMIRLVNDLLQLSRFDSQGVRINRRKLNIARLLEYAADRFHMQAEQQKVQMYVLVPEVLPSIHADPDAINQVVDNLLSNAIKYTPEGGSVTLHATEQKEQKRVYITVNDTGIGIPKRDLRRIFERFYRVDKARSRSQGGTGLGLAIARELVQAHGGDILISSELNEGTVVTFWMPIVEGGDQDDQMERTDQNHAS